MRSSAEAARAGLFWLAAAGLLAPRPAAAADLALLPAENLSGTRGASRLVTPLVERELAVRGWSVAPGAAVEAALARGRVRSLDSLSTPDRERLLRETGTGAYVATTILALRLEGIPLAALALRLVAADGRELFSEAASLSAEDTRRALDREPSDAIGPLIEHVIRRLCRDLPAPGEVRSPRRPAGAPLRLAAPRTFRSPSLDGIEIPRRVAVLPFRNRTRHRDVSRLVTLLAGMRLGHAGGFAPVEAADLRRALVAERIRDVDQIGPDQMVALGRRLGTSLFLTGTLYEWRPEPPAGSDAAPPEVELNLRLVDAATSRVLWTAHHRRKGSEYKGLLGLGTVTHVIGLADRALGEMVAAAAQGQSGRRAGGAE